jgi:hypothetical protein
MSLTRISSTPFPILFGCQYGDALNADIKMNNPKVAVRPPPQCLAMPDRRTWDAVLRLLGSVNINLKLTSVLFLANL